MLPFIINALQAFDNPSVAFWVGVGFIASYYAMSFISIGHDKEGYTGMWRKNGVVDIATSTIWLVGTITLIISFIDFLIRRQIDLRDALRFYALFIVLFAFVYRLLDWHFPGMLAQQRPGWSAELAALTVSLGAISGGDLGNARPARPLTEFIAALESLLGLLFVAIFIAQGVTRLTGHP